MTKKTTESESLYRDLEKMPVAEILHNINREDQKVALAVAEQIPAISALVEALVPRLREGGRLFYLGAGTSGRLGVVDASELPPTFGAPPEWVTALIAGGDQAIRKAVEAAEDDPEGGWRDLQAQALAQGDFVIGIAASGTTPYVVGALERCQKAGIATGCIVCNQHSALAAVADYPIEVVVGPEFVTGSTRMKAGSAQKMVLNMISTSSMIQLGRVQGNRMVDMQLNNQKLKERGAQMIAEATGLSLSESARLLAEHGQVRQALAHWQQKASQG